MNIHSKKYSKLYSHIFVSVIIIIVTSSPSLASFTQETLEYNEIVTRIIATIEKIDIQNIKGPTTYQKILADHLQSHPEIKQAITTHKSITVEFNDGYQLVILDAKIPEKTPIIKTHISKPETAAESSAVLLNPFAWVYGNRQCRIINRILSSKDILSTYVENDKVDLRYIENNLSAEIIYVNTHAGFWEINGSTRTESVVIATGELWTNQTPLKYQYEYTNNLIVEGVVGTTSYIAFTPALIEQYYNQSAFDNSFIYMATCHALYDESMASVFLDRDARVYVSWTQDTVFWTNNLASIWTFRLLRLGLPIKNICDLIGNGGFYNWLFESELGYVGDGNFIL